MAHLPNNPIDQLLKDLAKLKEENRDWFKSALQEIEEEKRLRKEKENEATP